MARKSDPQVYVATESGSADVNGEIVTFVKGVTRLRKGHPILAQLPIYFEAADEGLSYDVEDASAGPDEKRAAVVVGEQKAAEAPVVTPSEG